MTRIAWILAVSFSAMLAGIVGCSDDNPTTPIDPLTQGLVAYYDFDVADGTSNGNDGTLLGNAQVTGQSLATGNNDMDALSLPSSIVAGIGDFSFAGWVRLTALHPSQWISCATAADDNNLGIWYDPNNDAWSIDILGGILAFGANSVSEDGGFHLIVITRSGTTASLYVDVALVPSPITVPGGAIGVDVGGFIIGQDQDSVGGGFAADNSLAGEVDELRIYNRAISAADVAALHALGR